MSYIGYSHIETLLRSYPALKSLLYNHQIELRRLYYEGKSDDIDADDILYSLSIGNKVLSDMPFAHGGKTAGDKELGIIDQKDRMIQGDIRDKVQTINTIGEVVEKTTSALKSLSAEKRSILTDFYVEGWTWGEIATKTAMERTALKQKRTEAIRQMVGILRVTVEQYQFCMDELGGGEDDAGRADG